MELVYLWVENYKNIRNQGFNFSPRFEIEFFPKYDKDGKLEKDCDLKITPKDYVSIFPDNINITAIVGENGSGKSSILKSLNSYRTNDKLKVTILKIKNRLILFHNINDFISTNIIESNQTYVLTELNNRDLANINTSYKNILLPTITESLPLFISNSIIANSHKVFDTLNSIDLLQNANIKLPFTKPKKLYLKVKFAEDLDKDIQTQINIKSIQEDFIKKEIFYEDSSKYRIKQLKFYWLAQYIHLQRDLGNTYSCVVEKCNQQAPTNIDDLIHIFSECIGQEEVIDDIDFIIQEINDKFEYYDHYYWRVDIDSLSSEFINKVKSTLLTTSNVSLSIYDTFNFSFENQLSDGQYQFLLKFGKIYNYCQQDTLLLIDEGDILLHPNWQKKFINYMYKFLELNFSDYKYHLIITSHSPFILSDLPKENVIFLNKYDDKKTNEKYPNLITKDLEKGSCINVSKNIELKTFGANIHTLLSDGFFMSDGLMGEFAKSKIRTIQITYKYISHRNKQKFLHKKEHKKSRRFIRIQLKTLWYIQSIIGEKFLQTIMKNYLQEIEEILFGNEKAIDNEIERLQNLRKSIKNAKA